MATCVICKTKCECLFNPNNYNCYPDCSIQQTGICSDCHEIYGLFIHKSELELKVSVAQLNGRNEELTLLVHSLINQVDSMKLEIKSLKLTNKQLLLDKVIDFNRKNCQKKNVQQRDS